MSNTGERLAALVHDLERDLAPTGCSVTMRGKKYHEGVQITEYGVVINGSVVGASLIRWLLACRDRPSQGAVPREGILELAGQRQLKGFDKAFTVSTTGSRDFLSL